MTPPLRPCLQPCSFLPPYPAFKPRNELDRIHQAYFNFDPIIRTWITTLPPLIGPITMPAAAQPCFYDLGGTRPGALSLRLVEASTLLVNGGNVLLNAHAHAFNRRHRPTHSGLEGMTKQKQ